MRSVNSLKLALLACLLSSPALAFEDSLWRSNGRADFFRSVGTAPTNYPFDGMGTVTRAYALRRLLTSYTGNLIRLRRASDNAEADIAATATGAIDVATAATHCNATTCFVRTWYDQSGNTSNLGQATTANQPAFIFNCLGTSPCLQATASTQTMNVAAFTPATGVVSFSIVANRAVGTGQCLWMRQNAGNNYIRSRATFVDSWLLVGSNTAGIIFAAIDAAWNAANAVINAGASAINNNGTITLGSTTGNTTAGAPLIGGGASTTCNWLEASFFDNVAISNERLEMLTNSQRAWWGF
jgi:hypothetical protein